VATKPTSSHTYSDKAHNLASTKNFGHTLVFVLCLVHFAMSAPQTWAQNAVTTPSIGPSVTLGESQPTATTTAPSDLCPNATTSSSADNNLNDVQADIDRLGLCVERAKLLQQLDELVTKRQALLTGSDSSVNNLALPPLPLQNGQLNKGQTLQINATPALDNKTVANTLNRATPKLGNLPTPSMPPSSDTTTSNAWAIQRIWGQPPHIQAQLVGADKTIATVNVGEPLTDGYAVESISARGVILSRAGKLINLDWEKKTSPQTENILNAQPTLTQ
jgi:hypothetical protein